MIFQKKTFEKKEPQEKPSEEEDLEEDPGELQTEETSSSNKTETSENHTDEAENEATAKEGIVIKQVGIDATADFSPSFQAEEQVLSIRSDYNYIQRVVATREGVVHPSGVVVYQFFDEAGTEYGKLQFQKGHGGIDYARDYYFVNQELIFSFIYLGKEEHRLYFFDKKLFRYIDTDKNVFDLNFTGSDMMIYQQIAADDMSM